MASVVGHISEVAVRRTQLVLELAYHPGIFTKPSRSTRSSTLTGIGYEYRPKALQPGRQL